jgi:hypothetical protein
MAENHLPTSWLRTRTCASSTTTGAPRAQNGEDPTDYQAFRQHVIALGAPDPGEQEIDDFVGDDFKAAHPERYGAAGA